MIIAIIIIIMIIYSSRNCNADGHLRKRTQAHMRAAPQGADRPARRGVTDTMPRKNVS